MVLKKLTSYRKNYIIENILNMRKLKETPFLASTRKNITRIFLEKDGFVQYFSFATLVSYVAFVGAMLCQLSDKDIF